MKNALVSLLLISSISHATTCTDGVKNCLLLKDDARGTCMDELAQSASCDNSTMKNLIKTRASLSPIYVEGQDETDPSFLGPEFVDKGCIDSFDNELSGFVISGDVSQGTVSALESKLTSCKKEISDEFLLP